MLYNTTFKPQPELFVGRKADKTKAAVFSIIGKGVQLMLRPLITPRDRYLEQLILGKELRFHVNDRSWKRNSALLVYSRRSRDSIR